MCGKYCAEDIVLSGIAVRLPSSKNLAEFGENLLNGVDMVSEEKSRWRAGYLNLPRRNGRLHDLDKFDAQFFGVSKKLGQAMDPQQRMLLELTFEVLMDAGVKSRKKKEMRKRINPEELRGSRTGVYIGVTTNESEQLQSFYPELITGHILPGCHRSLLANRISYTFDLRGPSLALDTACSSTMVGLENAFSAIRLGKIDSAVVGACNLLLHPYTSLHAKKMELNSSDGKCKSFDISGDGYVRSEGVGVVFITRKSLARRHYATIRNIVNTNDGFKELGILYPSLAAQERLLRETYSEVGIHPDDIVYFEAHGPGTKAGDPQELNSLLNFCQRTPANPLLIGSVKSNAGHLEPASGVASIAKMVTAMQTGIIPGNLHYSGTPNAGIVGLATAQLKVCSQNTRWSGGIYGVNSFGWGGSNVHTIFESNPLIRQEFTINLPFLIPMSGRTEAALEFAFTKMLNMDSLVEVGALIQGIQKRRLRGHPFRGYIVATKEDSVIQKIQNKKEEEVPETWFIFSGMGSQAGIGNLIHIKQIRHSLKKSANFLMKEFNFDLMCVLNGQMENQFENVTNSFVTIVAIQIAVVDTLTEMGVRGDKYIGHSVGEISCAYADGCLTHEEALTVAYWRGEALLHTACSPGAMAAVNLSWEEATLRCPAGVFPACHNSRDGVTVSGPTSSVIAFMDMLSSEGIFVKEVKTSGFAFHSPYVAPAGTYLRQKLLDVFNGVKPRSTKWISTCRGPSACSVDYWVHNMISPVYFAEVMEEIPPNALVVEISPTALLQSVLRRGLPSAIPKVALCNQSVENPLLYFIQSLGTLYVSGLNPDFAQLYNPVALPVSLTTPNIHNLIQWDHAFSWNVPTYGEFSKSMGETIIEVSMGSEEYCLLEEYVINDAHVCPPALYLYVVWKAMGILNQETDLNKLPVQFRHLKFHHQLPISKEVPLRFYVQILCSSGEFAIKASNCIVATGFIHSAQHHNIPHLDAYESEEKAETGILEEDDVYTELGRRGCEMGAKFRNIVRLHVGEKGVRLRWSGHWISFLESLLQSRLLADTPRGFPSLATIDAFHIHASTFLTFLANNAQLRQEGILGRCDKNRRGVQFEGLHLSGLTWAEKGETSSKTEHLMTLSRLEMGQSETLHHNVLPTWISLANFESTPHFEFDAQPTYVILNASLSLEVAFIHWMSEKGAVNFLILTSPPRTPLQGYHATQFRKLGLNITWRPYTGQSETLENMFKDQGKIGGIFKFSGSDSTDVEFDKRKLDFYIPKSNAAYFITFYEESDCDSKRDERRIEELKKRENETWLFLPKANSQMKKTALISSLLTYLPYVLKEGGLFQLTSKEKEIEERIEEKGKRHLLEAIGTLIDIPHLSTLATSTLLTELGMDSAMAFELKEMMGRDFNIQMKIEEVRILSVGKVKELSHQTSLQTT